MKKLLGLLPVFVAVGLLHTGIEKKGSFDLTYRAEQAGASWNAPELQRKGSFDLMLVGGRDPELPVSG